MSTIHWNGLKIKKTLMKEQVQLKVLSSFDEGPPTLLFDNFFFLWKKTLCFLEEDLSKNQIEQKKNFQTEISTSNDSLKKILFNDFQPQITIINQMII